MRIGIDMKVLSKDKLAGIGWVAKKIVRYISETDRDNLYFFYSNKEIKRIPKIPDNCVVRVIPGRFGSVTEILKWHKAIKEDELDVFWGIEHILPRKIKGVKYVLTIHDLAFWTHPEWGEFTNIVLQRMLLKTSVNRADKILTISENSKKDIVRILNVDEDLIRVTYNPYVGEKIETIDKGEIGKIKTKYEISDRFFLFVSTIEPRKNIDGLVKAFEIVAQNNCDLSLVIVGKLGWKYKKMLQIIEDSQYKKRIILLGYITEQEKQILYTNCEAFVFPSHYEGFGLPVLEAMHFGSIVITANNSSLPEVGGDAVIYVEDENDYNGLANKMFEVLEMSDSKKNEYINRGKEQIKIFSDENTIGKMFSEIRC